MNENSASTTADVPGSLDPEAVLDELALARLWETRREAFVSIVRSHLSPKLERRIDAPDVVQAAFLRARDRIQWLGSSCTLVELNQKLDRIISEQTIDQLRGVLGAKRNADIEVRFPDESIAQLAMKLFRSQTTPSKALQRKEAIALVRTAVNRLGAVDKRIVSWRTDFDLSYRVIGQLLEPEMAENAVNRRYLRALEKLGKLLPHAESFF
jgi:RNA polymerase sigma factor (sigma-70 family)